MSELSERLSLTLRHTGRWSVAVVISSCVALGGLLAPVAFASSNHPANQNLSHTTVFKTAYKSGVLAYRRGEYHSALRHLRTAEQSNGQHVNTQYYLAIVLDKLSRGDEAVKYFTLVSQRSNDNRLTDYANRRILVLGGASAHKSVKLASNSNPSAGINRNKSFSIPLLNRKNALMLNATIDHQVSGTFIVDTGATYTSISQDMADQLKGGLTHIGSVRITTANGQIKVPKVLIKSITINGLEAHNVEATIINMHHGSSFSGLLGLSFIRQFQLTIDPVQNQLVFRSI